MEFSHKAPKGYRYEIEKNFKSNVDAIWLCHNCKYDYNLGKPVRTIWGFYHTKKKSYLAPINSKTVGQCVNIHDTTQYTAMPLKRTPLEMAYV